MEFPNKKYKIIYADPPYEYGNFSNEDPTKHSGKFKITPYPCMKIEDIKNLPVSKIAEKNSVLILWCTYPCLQFGLDIYMAWGFKYKTILFTWVKRNKQATTWFSGLGNYTKANAEVCMIGTKGKGCKVIKKNIKQICDSKLTKHSEKPAIIRNRIIDLFGNLPRIELFARTKIEGWDSWGNEVPKEEQRILKGICYTGGV